MIAEQTQDSPSRPSLIRKKKQISRLQKGESFVWLTSMGLCLGLIMIATLLTVVVKESFDVFWPSKVIEIRLKENSSASISGSDILAGEIRIKRQKRVLGDQEPKQEWQLFVGNRRNYGLSFRFVDENDILSTGYPKGIAKIERTEYGYAFGYLKQLNIKDRIVRFGESGFEKEVREAVHQANQRREMIKHIEKDRIGKINSKMNKLSIKKRALIRDGEDEAVSTEVGDIDAGIAELQSEYEILAKEAKGLRNKQLEDKLIYSLPTGGKAEVPIGNVIEITYPNRLNFLERIISSIHTFFKFISEDPREANTEGGIFPAIFGTFVMTVLMSVIVTPFGIIAAIYLREYAKQGFLVRAVRIAVNNLAGVPSIVFGVFGLGFFVYFVGGSLDRLFFSDTLPTPTFGTGGVLWAALTLALMTVPVVIVATEEALAAVPRGVREGSLAVGASKWQTIQRVVLPAAAPGIMTGFILAMARGAGEVAPLMLVGVVKLAPTLPLDMIPPFFHFERKFMHLGFHIYDLGFQSPDSEAAKPMVFATTLVLLGLVVVLNLTAIYIRQRLKKKYAVSSI